MKLKTKTLLLFILSANLFADNTTIIKPDSFNKNNNCIVTSKTQKHLGLLRFNSITEFKDMCNGKMFFIYKEDKCRIFTMKNMKFDIYIEDKYKKQYFKIGQEKKVCGKIIIETTK